MEHLPTKEEQDWIEERLAELIRVCGYEQFAVMPIVEPTRKHFPDRWTFSIAGLDRVTRRLLQYAGLGAFDVHLSTFTDGTRRANGRGETSCRSVSGMFLGIEGNRCFFAFNETSPGDAEHAAGVMAHEVAHAYRAVHEVAGPVSPEEEWATDLTSVYLGFGILTANNSYRYRTAGGRGYQAWSTEQGGYITPQAFGYALALQAVARDLTRSERHRVMKHLEANQAAFFEAAMLAVGDSPGDLLARLHLPPRTSWRSSVTLAEILQPLPPPPVAPPTTSPAAHAQVNAGRPVFRLRENRALAFGALSGFTGLFIGVFVALELENWWAMLMTTGLALALGLGRERALRKDVCSDPKCARELDPGLQLCPGCGGMIAGVIKHPGDRYEAEEDYEERQGRSSGEKRARKIRVPSPDGADESTGEAR